MNLTWWKRSLMVAGVAALLSLASKPWSVRSAEPTPIQDGQAFQYYGSATCKSCHNVTPTNPTPFSKAKDFIRLDEWAIWDGQDKHSIAYSELTQERGRRMARFLHIDDVLKPEAGCIGCHSATIAELKNRDPQGAEYTPSEGVSCENCHGPYSGWSARHLDPSFRTLGTAQWAKMGFTDLRKPEGKAEKCLSCHIGNMAEGKLVTHEMYAAGHPPLPGIEVATFANSIPRHWWLLAEPGKSKVKKSLGYEEGQLEQTKLAIVGAAVALKTSMKLLADEAKASKAEVPGQGWPDYARFDCWSCHHDLKRDGWRQARGFNDGPPGRVPVGEWPLALVELGIDRLALDDPDAEALRTKLHGLDDVLHAQANLRPFGRKDSIARAAEDLAGCADDLIGKLAGSKFDKAVAAKLLRKLVARAERSTPDYDSARHVAWTIKLFVEELGDSLADRPKIAAIVDEFDRNLKLTLPAGRSYEIEKQIGHALVAIGDYEPSTFREHLRALLPLLPKE